MNEAEWGPVLLGAVAVLWVLARAWRRRGTGRRWAWRRRWWAARRRNLNRSRLRGARWRSRPEPGAAAAEPEPAIVLAGRVVEFPDGDGVKVAEGPHGRPAVSLRLWGIDAPERPRQPFAFEAMQALAGMVAEADAKGAKGHGTASRRRGIAKATIRAERVATDKYGRVVVRLFDGNRDVGAKLVEAGLAWRYFDEGRYREAENAAKAAGMGVHGSEGAIPPWEWRKLHPYKPRTPAARAKPGRRWWPWAVVLVLLVLGLVLLFSEADGIALLAEKLVGIVDD